MKIARVVGSAVSTIKVDSLRGGKLLVVQRATAADELVEDDLFVAFDAIGAGEGELVLVSEGSAGRHTDLTGEGPVDAAIVAILDSLEVNGSTTFRK